MAVTKRVEAADQGADVSPPPEDYLIGDRITVGGEAFVLTGRRERAAVLESAEFSTIAIRVAVNLDRGSWVDIRLGQPFPKDTHVAGSVRSSESTQSAKGGGAEFLATLDLHTVDEAYFQVVSQLVAREIDVRPPRVVVADADALSRGAVVAAIRGLGEIREAGSARETVMHACDAKTPADILLAAAHFPDKDGIAMTRQLAEGGWHLPTVLLTTRYEMDSTRILRELPGKLCRLIEKPSGREELRGSLIDLLALGRAERQRITLERARAMLYRRLRDSDRQLRTSVGTYVNTRVLEQSAADGAGKTREISVLFADIRGSTRIIDKLAPEQAVAIVNKVLTALAEAVETHGGMVDKFLGDGLLALFGATGEDPYHRHRALVAGRTMVNRIKALNESGTFPSGIQVGVGVGIHSGQCILGSVGSEFRKEFTALGATVNTAARLQALAAANQIVLPATLAADLADAAKFEPLGTYNLKGFEKPVDVVRVAE